MVPFDLTPGEKKIRVLSYTLTSIIIATTIAIFLWMCTSHGIKVKNWNNQLHPPIKHGMISYGLFGSLITMNKPTTFQVEDFSAIVYQDEYSIMVNKTGIVGLNSKSYSEEIMVEVLTYNLSLYITVQNSTLSGINIPRLYIGMLISNNLISTSAINVSVRSNHSYETQTDNFYPSKFGGMEAVVSFPIIHNQWYTWTLNIEDKHRDQIIYSSLFRLESFFFK